MITKQFGHVIEIGDPVSQAKIYQDQAADELIFINIDKDEKSIDKLATIIRQVSQDIFMPMTVGGGVTNENDFRILLANGADKIAINTNAITDTSLISRTAKRFGSQCVVVSIDYKVDEMGINKVFINGGQERLNMDVVDWARKAEDLGAGEILLTSIDRDGMRNGLDLETISKVAEVVSIPVIAGGGCGLAKHFIDGFLVGKADAVTSGSFFAHRDQNLIQTRSHIKNAGVNIRVHT
ncbi:MAG: imidazole glycerol phosphate synthase cyclase subunit [Cyclobacteriaceae bacterium]